MPNADPQTECKYGHSMADAVVFVYKSGPRRGVISRTCRMCKRLYVMQARAQLATAEREREEWKGKYEEVQHRAERDGVSGATVRPDGSEAVVMDYPDAWAFVRTTNPTDHHDRCSWRQTNGALLCDCDVLNAEYERRTGLHPLVCPHGRTWEACDSCAT